MRKYIIITILLTLSAQLKSQSIATNYTTDWNSIKSSGFYQSSTANTSNSPDPQNPYYWGLNIAHDDPRYKGQLAFSANFNLDNPQMYIRSTNVSGNGIWAKVITNKGDHEIAGRLKAREISIEITAGADHVFGESYNLKPLYEVENFIKENNHLPEIPSEKQMQAEGLSINEFQIKLLQKIEELTLYTIELKKEIDQLKAQNQ